MPDLVQYRQLQYQYEVLKSRLVIREHYLKTIVKEVYDNITQMLSLTRIQLSLLRSEFETSVNENIDFSGELVERTIRDLRNLCQLFYPELEINSCKGFNRSVEQEMKNRYPGVACYISGEISTTQVVENEKGLVLFGILLEILTLINEQPNGLVNCIKIKWNKNKLGLTIEYNGEMITGEKVEQVSAVLNLSVFERMKLMGGYLQTKNKEQGLAEIKLMIPIN